MPGKIVPDYICHVRTLQHRDPVCQLIPGGEVDVTVARLPVETMTPMALELTLAVQAVLEARLEDADRIRRRQVERAKCAGASSSMGFCRTTSVNGPWIISVIATAHEPRSRVVAPRFSGPSVSA